MHDVVGTGGFDFPVNGKAPAYTDRCNAVCTRGVNIDRAVARVRALLDDAG